MYNSNSTHNSLLFIATNDASFRVIVKDFEITNYSSLLLYYSRRQNQEYGTFRNIPEHPGTSRNIE